MIALYRKIRIGSSAIVFAGLAIRPQINRIDLILNQGLSEAESVKLSSGVVGVR